MALSEGRGSRCVLFALGVYRLFLVGMDLSRLVLVAIGVYGWVVVGIGGVDGVGLSWRVL